MKKIFISAVILLVDIQAFAQNNQDKVMNEPISEIIIPIIFILSLVFMLISFIKYFLEYRLKNKMIERGLSEQLSAYLTEYNKKEKQNEAAKIAILFCGIALGLFITYLTGPIHLHSVAIMALSIGLSYWAYFYFLRK